MKRILCLMLTALFLLPLLSLAEGEVLFPARGDNGLWGYIDRTGAFVILPQYAAESPWLNGYACVTADSELWGIVDAAGAYALPMEYLVEWAAGGRAIAVFDAKSPDVKPTYAVQWSDTVCGIFDTLTGHFSGFQWLTADPPDSDSPYVPVMDDSMTWGWADAATGDMVIPCQFAYADDFRDGWAMAGLPYEDETGGDIVDVLVSEQGDIVYAPAGLSIDPWNGLGGGLIPVYNADDEYGFMDTEGNLVLEPRPEWREVWPFEGNFAVVTDLSSGVFEFIDRAGNILPGVRALPEGRGGYAFVNGLIAVFVEDPDSGVYFPGAMNEMGQIVFTLPDKNIGWIGNFLCNGLIWYLEERGDMSGYYYEITFCGLMDGQGRRVTDSLYQFYDDEGPEFSEGVAPVFVREDGKLLGGYIDEQGNWFLAPNYKHVTPFENGLAYVKTTDGRGGYIDRGGKEVYLWTTDENLYTWQSDLPR